MKPTGLNRFQESLLGLPDVPSFGCAVCGMPATDGHHVVRKGMGGMSARVEAMVPVVRLCRACHQLVHEGRLHLAWDEAKGGWVFLATGTPMGDFDAWNAHARHFAPLPGWAEVSRERSAPVFGRGLRK